MNKEFMDAWCIVKHKGPVMLPSVRDKVHKAMQTIRPYMEFPDWFELYHEISDHLCTNKRTRSGWDGICRDLEVRLGIYEPKRRKRTWYGAKIG
jgi:hypothetical protein